MTIVPINASINGNLLRIDTEMLYRLGTGIGKFPRKIGNTTRKVDFNEFKNYDEEFWSFCETNWKLEFLYLCIRQVV